MTTTRLDGRLFATGASSIAASMRAIGAEVHGTSELDVHFGGVSFDVYPLEPAEEGGNDFAIVGSIRSTVDEARELATKLGDALAAGRIVYDLELTDDDDPEQPMQTIAPPGLDAFRARRDRVRSPKRVTGMLQNTSHGAVVDALASLPQTMLGREPTITLTGWNFTLTFEPTTPTGTFAVTGVLRLPIDTAREQCAHIEARLRASGIACDIAIDGEAPHAAVATSAPKLVLGERLRTGSQDVVHAGTYGGAPALVTLTAKHAESLDTLRARLALPFDGIAPLLDVRASDLPLPDLLVEKLPAGAPATPTLAEPVLRQLGADLAAVLARVHAAGATLLGIRPELIYVDGGKLTALVPRGPSFIASAPMTRGIRSYVVPYLAPEELSNRSSAASDVFSLCATLFFLGSGTHPFGDSEQIANMVGRIVTGVVGPWPGSPALGDILARGLATDPAKRPSAAELEGRLRNP